MPKLVGQFRQLGGFLYDVALLEFAQRSIDRLDLPGHRPQHGV